MDQVFAINDLLAQILAYISDGATYKAARLVSSQWYIAATDRIEEFSDHLWTLINKFPDAEWSWYDVIENPNTPIEFIVDSETLTFKDITKKWGLTPHQIMHQLAENPNMIFE